MSSWIKAVTDGGWNFVDVDYFFWCSCTSGKENKSPLYCQDDKEVTCPDCGKTYRVVTRVSLQERIEGE